MPFYVSGSYHLGYVMAVDGGSNTYPVYYTPALPARTVDDTVIIFAFRFVEDCRIEQPTVLSGKGNSLYKLNSIGKY
jgi:hypothetical protein